MDGKRGARRRQRHQETGDDEHTAEQRPTRDHQHHSADEREPRHGQPHDTRDPLPQHPEPGRRARDDHAGQQTQLARERGHHEDDSEHERRRSHHQRDDRRQPPPAGIRRRNLCLVHDRTTPFGI